MSSSSLPHDRRRTARRASAASTCVVLGLIVGLVGCGSPSRRALPPGAVSFGSNTGSEQAVRVDEVGGFVEGRYEFERDLQRQSNLESREEEYQGTVGVHTSGSVYSRSFLLYDLAAALGVVHEIVRGTGPADQDTGSLEEYNGLLSFFPDRSYPARIFASRSIDRQPQTLLSESRSTSDIVGVQQSLRVYDWPVSASLVQREISQEQFAAQITTFELRERIAQIQASRQFENSDLSANYSYRDVDRDLVDRNYTENRGELRHRWEFDEVGRSGLRSSLTGSDQRGEFDRKYIRWDEILTVAHTERWTSDARLNYTRNDTNITESRILDGALGTSHQLFESLFSRAQIGASRQELGDTGNFVRPYGRGSLDYRKLNPWGRLTVGYGVYVERLDKSARDTGGLVLDAPFSFPTFGLDRIVLDQFGIEVDTIEITDTAGLVIYTEGLDYTVATDTAGRVEVTRVPSGLIPAGGSVLVDYQFVVPNDQTLDTLRQTLRIREDFDNDWAIYVGLRHQDQRLETDAPTSARAVREKGVLGGVDYDADGVRFTAEVETLDSTVLPYDAGRVRAEREWQFQSDQMLFAVHGSQSQTEFRNPDRRLRESRAGLRLTGRPVRRLFFHTELIGYYNDDSISGHAYGLGVQLSADYQWRKLSLETRFRHRLTSSRTSRFEGTIFEFLIRRDFGSARSRARSSAFGT
ncbi:MAG: hypothetical protein KDC38_08940 [Planctomycetes bacterium]|nr:hypothetical protein [Planctomycetota bacterium]